MMDDRDWASFKQKLKAKTEIDLDLYKEAQMKRRVEGYVRKKGFDSSAQYFDSIVNSKADFDAFIEHLTINVSEFFRNSDKFLQLEKEVIPYLLERSPKLNIWSAGCSIGAEPYSLAMILKEVTPGKQHRILATDLDIEILAKAKRGVYLPNEIQSMTKERVVRYFTQNTDGTYAVQNEIKRLIEFKRHNLLKDRFESGFDLILCRNVVIYFTEEAKFDLYTNFFKALKPGGILFVGGTESVINCRQIGYTTYKPFFYQRPLE
ncbi:protein-glutamate O-methyltransferase CheR [Selenomonas sp. TAMA-11512]|uniref:CheR family methyltransferase n=1 Tax=Selenomonas sp. TAMA-11512 TaxID=3095337 RepID=UPI00308A7982|nr:protein-glutamate O-methyltransferase CheR [Selenomonas sp. TAMA-11512]